MDQIEIDRRNRNKGLINEYRFWKHVLYVKIKPYQCSFHIEAQEKAIHMVGGKYHARVMNLREFAELACKVCLVTGDECKEHLEIKERITEGIKDIIEFLGNLMPKDLHKFEKDRPTQMVV